MDDLLSNKREIAQLFNFYFRPGFEAAGKRWTSDNDAEMDHLADLIIKEIEWKIERLDEQLCEREAMHARRRSERG